MRGFVLGFVVCLMFCTGVLVAQEAGVFEIEGFYNLKMDPVSKTANLHLNSLPPRQTSPYRYSYDVHFVNVTREGYESPQDGVRESVGPPTSIVPERLDDARVAWMLTEADKLNSEMTDEEWADLSNPRIGVSISYQFFTGPDYEGDFEGVYIVVPRNGVWNWTREEHASSSASQLEGSTEWPNKAEEEEGE